MLRRTKVEVASRRRTKAPKLLSGGHEIRGNIFQVESFEASAILNNFTQIVFRNFFVGYKKDYKDAYNFSRWISCAAQNGSRGDAAAGYIFESF